jgi:hypothetical protein
LAIQRKTTGSAIAAEILDRNLPRLSIVWEGQSRLAFSVPLLQPKGVF